MPENAQVLGSCYYSARLHQKAGRRVPSLDEADIHIGSVFAGPTPNGISLEAIF